MPCPPWSSCTYAIHLPSAETVVEWMLPVVVTGEIVICAKDDCWWRAVLRSCRTSTTTAATTKTAPAILIQNFPVVRRLLAPSACCAAALTRSRTFTAGLIPMAEGAAAADAGVGPLDRGGGAP